MWHAHALFLLSLTQHALCVRLVCVREGTGRSWTQSWSDGAASKVDIYLLSVLHCGVVRGRHRRRRKSVPSLLRVIVLCEAVAGFGLAVRRIHGCGVRGNSPAAHALQNPPSYSTFKYDTFPHVDKRPVGCHATTKRAQKLLTFSQYL